MSKAIGFLAALAFVACTSASSASAALISFTADLEGANEVPPVVTDADGLALLVLDTSNNEFQITVLAQGIDLAELSGSHIHVGGPEENGPFFINLMNTAFNQIGGVLFRQMSGEFPADKLPDLFAGDTYVNLHTRLPGGHPGGEIRGQLVPEPATLALLGVGVVVAVARRRRR